MKVAIIIALALGFALSATAKTVHVRAHVTKTGTYVPAHVRTAPDHSKANNWSSKPNVNPYTGKAGTKDPNAPKH